MKRKYACKPPMLIMRGLRNDQLELRERAAVQAFALGYATTEHYHILADMHSVMLLAGSTDDSRKWAWTYCREVTGPVLQKIAQRYQRTKVLSATTGERKALGEFITRYREFWLRQPLRVGPEDTAPGPEAARHSLWHREAGRGHGREPAQARHLINPYLSPPSPAPERGFFMDICKMNARDNTPLRTLIAAHLDEAGECTALAIAKAVGKGDVPSVVVKELNAMRTDGQVECEQRKKEMLYWLAVPLAQIAGGAHEAPAAPASDLPPGVREGTRAAQIYRTLPKFGGAPMTAREIATATGCAKGLIAPVLTAMDKASQVTRIPAGVEGGGLYGYTRLPPAGGDSEGGETDIAAAKNIPPPQYDPEEVASTAPADPAEKPAAVNARLADAEQRALLAAEMLAERGRTVETLQDMICTASETLAPHVPGNLDTSDMDLQEIADRVVAGVADLAARLENKDDELLKQAAVIVDLRSQLEGLQREAMRGATCLSGQERYTAAGYLVRATKRKPRTLQAEDKAREAALGAIRAGAPRAEVFALVPVGHARRGVEWRSA